MRSNPLWDSIRRKAMTGTNNGSRLKWKTLAKRRQSSTQGIPPGKEALQWVANTVTLIYGDRDAILVDTFLSEKQTRELVDWIAASGKHLTAIYVTHAHGDHFFGIGMLEERFPGARAVATAEVIDGMRRQISPEFMSAFWNPRFPGQLPEKLTVAAEIRDGDIDLEGQALVPVRLGHTDTADSTCLHVPSVDSSLPETPSTTASILTSPKRTLKRAANGSRRSTPSSVCSQQRSSRDIKSQTVTIVPGTSAPRAHTFEISIG